MNPEAAVLRVRPMPSAPRLALCSLVFAAAPPALLAVLFLELARLEGLPPSAAPGLAPEAVYFPGLGGAAVSLPWIFVLLLRRRIMPWFGLLAAALPLGLLAAVFHLRLLPDGYGAHWRPDIAADALKSGAWMSPETVWQLPAAIALILLCAGPLRQGFSRRRAEAAVRRAGRRLRRESAKLRKAAAEIAPVLAEQKKKREERRLEREKQRRAALEEELMRRIVNAGCPGEQPLPLSGDENRWLHLRREERRSLAEEEAARSAALAADRLERIGALEADLKRMERQLRWERMLPNTGGGFNAFLGATALGALYAGDSVRRAGR